MLLIFVAIGSALGGVCRYLLGFALQHRFGPGFPIGTLVINITGSLLIGIVLRASMDSTWISPQTRMFLATGFCGGYTTFSSFSYETAMLIENGAYGRAGLYVTLSVVLSLAATFGGFALAPVLLPSRITAA